MVAVAELYIQGVSTRRVKSIVEELCGLDANQASRNIECDESSPGKC